MPSDQLLKCLTITTLGLLDQDFLVFRFVNSLCGPFQYGFHGHGVLDARETERLEGDRPILFITQKDGDPVSWMNDTEVVGFVPGNYSIDRSLVCGGNLVQGLALFNLVDHFFAVGVAALV